jgi:hypothetical protein
MTATIGVLTEHELSDLRSRGWLDDFKADELRELSNRYLVTIAARDAEIARVGHGAEAWRKDLVAARARVAQLEAALATAIPYISMTTAPLAGSALEHCRAALTGAK